MATLSTSSPLTPKRLNSRHRMIATLEALGLSYAEIAERVGCHPVRIVQVRRSPLYQALLMEEQRAVATRMREGRLEQIEALFPDAIEAKTFAIQQRENLPVMNAAADSILDRVAPRAAKGAVGEGARVVHVRLTVEDERRIALALEEDPEPEPIDVTPDEAGAEEDA